MWIGYGLMIPGFIGMESSGGEVGMVLIIVGGILMGISALAGQGLQITCFVFWCLDGTPGENRFGTNPKEVLE